MSRNIVFLSVLFLCTSTFAQDSKMNKFISDLMSKMTLEEKIGQLNLVTPGGGIATGAVVSNDVEAKIKKGAVGGLFGIYGPDKVRKAQEIAVNQSRLKIPLLFGLDVIHGHKTVFPIPLGLSCSWNPQMIEESARIAATEATADGLNWVFSPMVDIAHDPRWGRVAEGAGEDPYLGSLIAKAMVKGYQGDDLSKDNTAMACVKHFALYGASEAGRDYNTVDMSRIRMYQDYLPPYKAAVDAGVGSIMSSFNEIDGIPATGNKWLLTDLLRKEWDFDGLVVSDYTSVSEMINHGMGDLQAVSALSLNAGLDMDMVAEGFLNTLKKSLDEGKVSLSAIERACRNVLVAKYRLGLFDDPYRYVNEQRPARDILTAANRAKAKEFAMKSYVLLKNMNQVLPLKKSGRVALVGPLADDKRNMLGTWAVAGNPDQSISVLTGLKNLLGNTVTINYAKGANLSDDPNLVRQANVFGLRVEVDKRTPDAMITEAVAAANKSDVVVAVIGEASEMTGEAASRSDISIPASQRKLLEALKKTGKPLVLVVMSGRPLTLEWEDANATAILQCWFSGIEAGNAIASVLFGDYNPSGKLSMSFPYNVGQIPIYYNHKFTGRPMDPNNKFSTKYLDVSNEPLYPFGHGLSYTTFTYRDLKLSSANMSAGQTLTASVTLTNSGKFDGTETVQLYIRDMVGSVTRPVKELKQFQQVFLKAGESKTITFNITVEDLKFWNGKLEWDYEPGEFKAFIGSSSRDVKEASFTLK